MRSLEQVNIRTSERTHVLTYIRTGQTLYPSTTLLCEGIIKEYLYFIFLFKHPHLNLSEYQYHYKEERFQQMFRYERQVVPSLLVSLLQKYSHMNTLRPTKGRF